MKAIVQISISHSNSLDLRNFLEKVKIAAGLDADNYPAVLERFLEWLGEEMI